MSSHQRLLADIEDFLAETGMAPSTFGRRAVNDSKIVPRLRNHTDVTLATADRLRAFMASERAEQDAA